MHAAARRSDDVVVSGEVLREESLGGLSFGATAGVGHRLPAARLVKRVVDFAPEALKQLQRSYADLGLECVDLAGTKSATRIGHFLSVSRGAAVIAAALEAQVP